MNIIERIIYNYINKKALENSVKEYDNVLKEHEIKDDSHKLLLKRKK